MTAILQATADIRVGGRKFARGLPLLGEYQLSIPLILLEKEMRVIF